MYHNETKDIWIGRNKDDILKTNPIANFTDRTNPLINQHA